MGTRKPERRTVRPADDQGTKGHENPEQMPEPLQSASLNVGHLFRENLRLRDEFERIRRDIIWTDLEVCLTLTTVVQAYCKLGKREHAKRALAAAEKGYSDMFRFFSQAKGLTVELEKAFQSKFNYLREQLDELRQI